MNFVSVNGQFFPENEPVLQASNRSYRYGDGLFETMLIRDGGIRLGEYHFERLFTGLSLMQFKLPALFTREKMFREIMTLCEKNKCIDHARVRLSLFRGNGGLYEEGKTTYLLEAWPLDKHAPGLNVNGLVVGISTLARKSCDLFSGIKSSSALAYSLGAIHAKENGWNDAVILNSNGNIADSTIANIFLVKDKWIVTPAAPEGCVMGVMRRWLLENLQATGYQAREEVITPATLKTADEVFLTNAIKFIRWVKQCEESSFGQTISAEIYHRFSQTIPTWHC